MKFLLVLAVVLVAAESKVLPASDVATQQTNGEQPLSLEDTFTKARDAITSFGADLQKRLNMPEQEEFLNTMKEHGSNFINNMQSYMNNMTEQIKTQTPELESKWNDLKTVVSDKLKEFNPEAAEQVDQIGAKIKESMQTMLEESEKISKTMSERTDEMKNKFAWTTKSVLDAVVEASQNFQNHLQQKAQEAPQS